MTVERPEADGNSAATMEGAADVFLPFATMVSPQPVVTDHSNAGNISAGLGYLAASDA